MKLTDSSIATLTSCTLSKNIAEEGAGGAVALQKSSSATMTSCTLSNNRAEQVGTHTVEADCTQGARVRVCGCGHTSG